ncbi:MAG TPA: glycosyl transferase [Deltaproteobacteria bacterium]|jgi:glycosyltransferase involved in cell wall biosynthesis|nr:glycosyl transferase [Deltaproteobacteria bacterium]
MKVQDEHGDLPFVSVIVPAYNAERMIEGLVNSLLCSDYPRDRFEVIVVDNGSRDTTRRIVEGLPVILLEENEIQSSYAARNRGLMASRGEIVAFTDADCRVDPDWIGEGVRALETHSADLIGGKIEFFFSKKRTTAELCDAARAMRNDRYIAERNGCITANLFVKASVFRALGPFSANVKSGGDMMWTTKATAAGYILRYEPKAVVYHPARKLREILSKNLRVGGGVIGVRTQGGATLSNRISTLIQCILPPSAASIEQILRKGDTEELRKRRFRLWAIMYLGNLCQVLGAMYGVLTAPIRKRRIFETSNLL